MKVRDSNVPILKDHKSSSSSLSSSSFNFSAGPIANVQQKQWCSYCSTSH